MSLRPALEIVLGKWVCQQCPLSVMVEPIPARELIFGKGVVQMSKKAIEGGTQGKGGKEEVVQNRTITLGGLLRVALP